MENNTMYSTVAAACLAMEKVDWCHAVLSYLIWSREEYDNSTGVPTKWSRFAIDLYRQKFILTVIAFLKYMLQ